MLNAEKLMTDGPRPSQPAQFQNTLEADHYRDCLDGSGTIYQEFFGVEHEYLIHIYECTLLLVDRKSTRLNSSHS